MTLDDMYMVACKEGPYPWASKEEFKQDLFIALGIQDNKKRERLFEIAWKIGQNSGYAVVIIYAVDLVDLIQ